MGKEIERKWLVKNVPFDLIDFLADGINQEYLEVSNPDDDEVRLRKKGDKYFLTIKKGEGIEREESEVEIPVSTYDFMLSSPSLTKLGKLRYKIPDGKRTIEFDVYHGNLEGLLIAEVEFDTIEESKSYETPKWFGKEVTEDKRYKNKNLARYGLPKD